MFRSHKPRIADFRADYAKLADFCEVLTATRNLLYLLAFLLTANHKQSERCFVWTAEGAFKERAMFKQWARSWVRSRLIENAIEIVSPASGRESRKPDLWSSGQCEPQGGIEIDTVTRLGPLNALPLSC